MCHAIFPTELVQKPLILKFRLLFSSARIFPVYSSSRSRLHRQCQFSMDSWIHGPSSWLAMILLCGSAHIPSTYPLALKLICSAYLNFLANFLNTYHVFQLPVCPANFLATFQHILRLLQLPLRPPTLISRKITPKCREHATFAAQ